jgi:hypothetical protein
LLHDAYVASGFMQPHPSGLRVTPYHALPTTTTLYARFGEQIVGTLSIIREGVFGFPLQSVFDLTAVRALPGRIAEISALAIHPDFRNTGGAILFPLMKFMYEYCTKYFDTRHLVIAVNPKHIDMYESVLLFRRLQAQPVASYDFVNGAPAVGATLDLASAAEAYRAVYEGRRTERNLHHYFTKIVLPNICFPTRPYHTTNDPVMSPELLDHFFVQRTAVFDQLDERQWSLLQAIYPEQRFRSIFPQRPGASAQRIPLRQHSRHSLKCPAQLYMGHGVDSIAALEVIDASRHGLLARSNTSLPERTRGTLRVQLGVGVESVFEAVLVRDLGRSDSRYYGFHIHAPDAAWTRCIEELEFESCLSSAVRDSWCESLASTWQSAMREAAQMQSFAAPVNPDSTSIESALAEAVATDWRSPPVAT